MAGNRNRRLQKEIKDIQQDQHAGISVEVIDEASLNSLRGSFAGPPDTPYAGGIFEVEIQIPPEYPFKPPKMRLETKTWHPNISSQTGAICLDTLSSAWSPILTLKSALISLQGLLASPEPKDPQDATVAAQLIKDPKGFAKKARQWTQLYAGGPADPHTDPAGSEVEIVSEEPRTSEETANRAIFKGYSPLLVGRFAGLGFDTAAIVAAFEEVGLETNGGHDYPLAEEEVSDVTEVLFNDS